MAQSTITLSLEVRWWAMAALWTFGAACRVLRIQPSDETIERVADFVTRRAVVIKAN